MRCLIIDSDRVGLDLAMRAAAAGHEVKLFRYQSKPTRYATGFFPLFTLVDRWQDHMAWARDGIVVLTANNRYVAELERYREFGFEKTIFAPSVASAELEIERSVGMRLMEAIGANMPPYQTFNSLDEIEAFALKSDKCWVFKPAGSEEDKSSTYVSKDAADLVGWIRRKKKSGTKFKGKLMLQERVDRLCELGISGWMGPEGFIPEKFQLCWEHKPLCDGDVGPACFTPDAEVLTVDGWKAWPSVTEEDLICSLEDENIKFVSPSRVVCEDFDGDLVGWESPTVNILVTPGHNMYVQDDHYRKPFWFEPAIETFGQARTIMRAGGEWKGEMSNLPSCARSGAIEWAALLGAYIADGNCKKNSIVFGNCPSHKSVEFIKIASAAGFEAKMYGRDLYINSIDLVTYCKDFGLSMEKYVPQYIKNSPPPMISAFLRGYGLGDGNRRSTNLTYSTSSSRLADDLHELCLKVGWAASVATRDRRGESHMLNGYECVNRLVGYEVRVSQTKSKSELSPSCAYREKYQGKVYCVTVPSHVIYVRRNGKSCWIGQTGEMGSCTAYCETDPLAQDFLLPLETALRALNHRGDTAINCIIDKQGKAWFLEFTMRCGYPAWWIQVASHKGDPLEWMKGLLCGQDKLRVSFDPAIGVVMGRTDFPYDERPPADAEGLPLRGADDFLADLHLVEVMKGTGPTMVGGKVMDAPGYQTAGTYVAVATSLGRTVTKARERAYNVVDQISWPDRIYRTDIGKKVIDSLPALHKHGYALDVAP